LNQPAFDLTGIGPAEIEGIGFVPTPGGTKTDHLDDNLPAADVRLSAEGLREIDYIFPTTPLQSCPGHCS
jgi:aryl-alcohol dehydrogenase-like predicted oxidoreductase